MTSAYDAANLVLNAYSSAAKPVLSGQDAGSGSTPPMELDGHLCVVTVKCERVTAPVQAQVDALRKERDELAAKVAELSAKAEAIP